MACDNGCCNTTPRIVQLPASSALDGGPYTVDLNTPDDGIFRVTDTTSGETFEVDVHQLQCDFFSERLVLDTSASTAGADFGAGALSVPPISDGTFDPGEAAHQAYIDANIDYTTPDGVSNSLTIPDQNVSGQTDGGFIEFWVVVPAGTTRTLTWEWSGEGYARVEVAECGAGDYVLADSIWSTVAATDQITVTLEAGVHLVRATNVDSGGSSSIWAYVGDPIEFYAASGAAPVVSTQLVAVDCDGNAVDANGDPLVGTLVPMADWPCPVSNVIVEAGNIVGELFTVNAGTSVAAGDDANGSAAIEVGETLHFYQGAPGEPLLVTEGSGIVRLPNDEALCGIPGEEELITAAAGTLADGTTWAVTGGTALDFGTVTPGDVRWNGTITLTFSSPVNLILRPTTLGDPVIIDPNTWTYQNGQSPNHTSATRFNSVDGLPVIVDSPGGEVFADGQFARPSFPAAAGTTASSPWGTVFGPAGTTFEIRASNSEAMNISAAPLDVSPICEVTADIYARLALDEPAEHPAGQVAACFGPAQISNGGATPNADLQSEFTPHHDGDYTFVHEGSGFNTGTANGGFSVGTTVGAGDVYVSGGTVPTRINAADPRREVTVTLTGGVTYFLAQWAGGGSSYETSLCVAEAGLSGFINNSAGNVGDPASTEVGNLIVEGDDGEEYALPLKSEACYDETLAPQLLAGFDATDPNDDFAIDDQFFTVSNNTGADQELGAVQFVTDGAWPATDRTISFAGGGLSGSVVVPGGTPSGTTITVLLDTAVVVVDGGTQSIQLTTSDFSGAQGTGVANAMIFGGIVRHMVRTYSDGETEKVIDFDVNGEPQELTSIPAEWVPCPVFDQDAIDAIKQQITDCQVVSTECYVEVEGVRQYDVEGEDTGGPGLPQTLLFPSTASGAGSAGDIIVHFNDVGATPLVEIKLTIIADGVPVETRTDERELAGVSDLFRFGYFEFQAGVEYELQFETLASNINLYGTINPVSDDGITFPVGTNAAFGIPQIRIVSPGESQFRVVTDAQGVVTAYNAAGDVVPATLNEWMLCPLDTTERAEVERLIAENECPPIGVTEVLDQIETSGPTLGGPGTPVAPAVATTLSQGATGQTRTTIVPFHGRLPGETFDVIVRVTRLSAGGGGIVLQPSGAFSNTSGATDHDIEFELADGQSFRWAVFPASAGGAEAFQFLTQPVVEYAQGAGAPALTLPFNGSWSNGNNSASSGFGFDASTVLNFRSLGTAGAGSSFQVALREVPTFPEQTPCERSAGMLDYVNDEVAASAPAAQFRVSAGTGPVDILESDLSASKSAVLIAHASEQTQINIPASIFTAANVGQSVTVLINSTLGGQSPEITNEDVEGDGGNGVFAFEDSFELFSAGVGFGYVIPHRG